jgi:hypothetical protein
MGLNVEEKLRPQKRCDQRKNRSTSEAMLTLTLLEEVYNSLNSKSSTQCQCHTDRYRVNYLETISKGFSLDDLLAISSILQCHAFLDLLMSAGIQTAV